ncbi:coproporphyrinogen III oxidase [Bacteroidia bacterium]|nr:coproporphyrinogen III oxidase [Bacteroidia bacterium]GHT27158.1 coproporphyrinogen III oxidase [Bacteroidia bacterium]
MAGIYIHIPFCKKRCLYCDFFSSTNGEKKAQYVEALCEELHDRKDYLQGQVIETIYFGGGTPSQLSAGEFEKIFDTIHSIFENISDNFEITLEANPDDITPDYLNSIQHLPFNRISLGIQSFDDKELQFLNRRHDAHSAITAIQLLQKERFDNISIDLMYGLPGQTPEIWEKTLRQAMDLDVQHISAYHLIYEENTPLFSLLEQGKITPVDEELSVQLFEILIDKLEDAGFEHYEISNFAKHGYRSRHNSSYWTGAHYLGIGASAHSYNGLSRQWNKETLDAGYRAQDSDLEIIDAKTAYNDFIITRLRMKEGIDLRKMISLFDADKKTHCLQQAQKYIENQLLELKNNHLRLTRKGIFISDGIMSDLLL